MEKTIKKSEKQTKDWKKIFVMHISDQTLVFRICNICLQFSNKENNSILKMTRKVKGILEFPVLSLQLFCKCEAIPK